MSAVIQKLLTPRMSTRVSRFAAVNYSPFFVGTYLARRDNALMEARFATEPEIRARAVFNAKYWHRDFMRCLREARRDGALS